MKNYCLGFVVGLVVFAVATVGYAQDKLAYKVTVPDKIGKIKERYVGQTESVIVHVQDAHANLEAQQNIANIIEFLVRKDTVSLVGIEGGYGLVDVSFYRGLPFADNVKTTAMDFIKQGYFTGAEYAAITSEQGFELIGIEKKDLMDTNYKAYLQVRKMQEAAVKEFGALDVAILSIEKQLTNEPLKQFLAVFEAYEDEMTDFVDYSTEVIKKAKELGVDIVDYADLQQYTEYVEKKNTIDLDKLEQEKEALLKIFEKRSGELDENSTYKKLQKAIVGENRLFSENEIENMMVLVAREFSIPEEQYKNLNDNLEVERKFQLFNIGRILKETDLLTYVVLDKLAANGDEKKLISIRRMVKTILKMVKLEALKNDVIYFRDNRATIMVNDWYSFVESQAQAMSVQVQLAKASVDYAKIFDATATYYEAAIERDRVLAENMIALMKEKNITEAIMVCGGYHTEGITEALRELGQSYLVVMPRITTASEEIPLEKRLSGELFGVDKLAEFEKQDKAS